MANALENLLGVQPDNTDVVDDNDELEDEVDETDEDSTAGKDSEAEADLGDKGKETLRKLRREKRELQRKVRELEQTKTAPNAEASVNEDELRSRIEVEVANKYAVKVAHAQAVNILTELGYKGKPERGVKNLDLSDVIVDGEVDEPSLRDAIEDWKEDEPQLFRRSRSNVDEADDDEVPARRRNPGAADLGHKKAPKVATDPLAQALNTLVGRKELA